MMTLIIAALMTLGLISAPDQATDQIIKENKTEIQAIVGDDVDAF